MSTRKEEFNKGCFAPNWLEIDLDSSKEERQFNKEVRLESNRRKDLNTLLKELEQIKENIEKVAEKQQRLANLMNFYTGQLT